MGRVLQGERTAWMGKERQVRLEKWNWKCFSDIESAYIHSLSYLIM